MIHAKKLPYHFWAEAMNTACYIHNRVTIRSGTSVTLYELWKGRKPTVKYFHVFGSKCYILADREQRRKMDPKSDEGIFLGYSTTSKAYRVFNSRTKVMMESINVVVDDIGKEEDVADDVGTSFLMNNGSSQDNEVKEDNVQENNDTPVIEEVENTNRNPSIRILKDHPTDLIIGNLNEGVKTRSREVVSNACFVSKLEPKNVKEALTDEFWINAMQDELCQFKRNEVWELVPRPEGTNVIGTKWIYKNKSDE